MMQPMKSSNLRNRKILGEVPVRQDAKSRSDAETFRRMASYNMVLTEAIFELLAEREILTGSEVKERIAKLKRETQLKFCWLQ
jgi:hypothetical protein